MTVIELDELGSSQHSLADEQGQLLARSELVNATPVVPGMWRLAAKGKVGAVRIGEIELRIRPKLDIRRLLFLAGYTFDPRNWHDTDVDLGTDAGLVPAAANALWRLTERVLQRGLLQGYQDVEETAFILRGRLREAEQLRRHHGRVIPMELRHDEFTVDIAENRILLAAITRMLTVPRVDPVSRQRLTALRRRLTEMITPIHGPRLPAWQPNRLNDRYHPALRLAEVIWQATSPEHVAGGIIATGFLFDVPTLFENFVTVALAEALPTHAAGDARRQFSCWLDEACTVRIRPDLVWRVDGNVVAVVDAKYKIEGERSGYPNEDIYQMLAYCASLGPRRGHLVYAKGSEVPIRHVVRRAGIEIVCHALDLTRQPDDLRQWIDDLAAELTGH
jgi:5-methylcytosine-specific restriction enzyme subunit McrC